ncbi:MAG: hypothetical protein JW885_11580 [Deltaproteobacteria bacterium]|nr:hypothetical protein [Candidatus Zymogenaceae bacterium]
MSFFVVEHFNLPNGAVQESIKTATKNDGNVYTSNGWGITATYADTDAAMITCDKGLKKAEFVTIPFRTSIKYKLSALRDGDYIRLFVIQSLSAQPEPSGSFTNWVLSCNLYRIGSNYREYWFITNSSGTARGYNGIGGTWGTTSNYVRTVSLNTEYTLIIQYDPTTKTVFLNNGIQSTDSEQLQYYDDHYWWFVGDNNDNIWHGIIKFDYIIVEQTEIANTFISHNNLLTEKYHSNHFNGSALWVLNDFTTEVADTLTIKNDILDYDLVESDSIVLNRIGGGGSQVYIPSVKVLLNERDVTSQVLSYFIDWSERFVKMLRIDFDWSISAEIYRKNNADFKIPQIEIQVDHDSSGMYITRGEFFIEEISETMSNGRHAKRISGRSKAALLDRPYSAQNTVSYENTTKRAIVTNLVEEAGLEYEWCLPDGPIEYHTFDARTPMEVIKEVVSAVGGHISTGYNDKLYFHANDYTPRNHPPVFSVDSSDIHQIEILEEIPQSFNKIVVKGRANNEATFRAWAEVELVSVDSRGNFKSTLAADGNDYTVLIATCYDSEGMLVDTGLIEEESATPSNANTIAVLKRIANGGVVGIWPDIGGGVPGTKVDGPYIFDDFVITTTGNMLEGPHLVTYHGGDSVSFSVEGPGIVEENSVLVENGQGRTKLYGNELGAGTIYVKATYDGQESNPVALILGDPRVGDLDANANPSSLLVKETSVITARVYDPDGDPVGDGYTVKFKIIAGNGALSADLDITTTNTIENEEQVSSSYTSIRVQNPISNLTHIYALKDDSHEYQGRTIDDDEIDTSYDYATGAITEGSTITLSDNLPKPQTRVVVTYKSGGTAQIVYTAPSFVDREGEEVVIEVWAGGLNHLVFIDVGRKEATTPSVGGGKRVGVVTFHVDHTPTSAERGRITLSEPIPQVSGFVAVLGSYTLDGLSAGVSNGQVVGLMKIGENVVATIHGERDTSAKGDYWNGDYIRGSRRVYIINTETPVPNASVKIEWNGGDESGGHTESGLKTNSEGVFTFTMGVSGTHIITITHDNPQSPDAPLGFLEYLGTITIPGQVGDERGTVGDQVFYKHMSGSFSVPIIYEKI